MSETDVDTQEFARMIKARVADLNEAVGFAGQNDIVVRYSVSDSDNPIIAVTVAQRI